MPLPAIGRPSRLAVSDHGGDTGWIASVNAALGGLEVRDVPPTPNGAKWWGTRKLVESVAYPVDVEALGPELTAAAEPWTCRWCGEPIAGSPCPLCGHRGRSPHRQHGART